MRRSRIAVVVDVILVAAISLIGSSGAASAEGPRAVAQPPFVTGERPFLVPLEDGVVVRPILTTGDVIGEGAGAYQMSGVPDGIGWYESADGGIEVFFNHELH